MRSDEGIEQHGEERGVEYTEGTTEQTEVPVGNIRGLFTLLRAAKVLLDDHSEISFHLDSLNRGSTEAIISGVGVSDGEYCALEWIEGNVISMGPGIQTVKIGLQEQLVAGRLLGAPDFEVISEEKEGGEYIPTDVVYEQQKQSQTQDEALWYSAGDGKQVGVAVSGAYAQEAVAEEAMEPGKQGLPNTTRL